MLFIYNPTNRATTIIGNDRILFGTSLGQRQVTQRPQAWTPVGNNFLPKRWCCILSTQTTSAAVDWVWVAARSWTIFNDSGQTVNWKTRLPTNQVVYEDDLLDWIREILALVSLEFVSVRLLAWFCSSSSTFGARKEFFDDQMK